MALRETCFGVTGICGNSRFVMSWKPVLVMVLGCLSVVSTAGRAGESEPLVIDEPPAPLRAKSGPSETAQDRVEAGACYAHARLLLARDDKARALDRLERAWRYDPRSVSLLKDIVPLAAELERAEEAVRYAVIAAERETVEPHALRQLGSLLAARNDLPRAVRMYEKFIAASGPSPLDASLVKLELGRLYFVQGRYAEAADVFAAAQKLLDHPESFGLTRAELNETVPDRTRSFTLIAEANMLADRCDAATVAFDEVRRTSADNSVWPFHAAQLAARQKRWDEARGKLDQYFATKSTQADEQPYKLLREILTADGKPEADQRLFARLEELRQQDPENRPLRTCLARGYLEAGQLDRAEPLYAELLKHEPSSGVFEGLARIYRQRRDAPALLAIMGRVTQGSFDLDLLGREFAAIRGDSEAAAQLVECGRKKLTVAEAQAFRECFALSLLLVGQKQYDLADLFYTRAFQIEQVSEQTRMIEAVALRLYEAEQYDRAANLFRSLLSRELPADGQAVCRYFLAGALEMCGSTDEAVRWAEEAAVRRPDSHSFQIRPAWTLQHARRYADSEKRYQDLLSRWGRDYKTPGVREAVRQVRLALAAQFADQTRIADAEEQLQQVLDEFPEDAAAGNDLGYMWADRGLHLQRALAMTRSAVAANPQNSAYRDSLGWVYFRLERYDEAVKELEQSVAGAGQDGTVLDHLGDAYLKVDQKQKAIDAWKRAASAFHAERETTSREKIEQKIRQCNPG